jgi:hypothetical protein
MHAPKQLTSNSMIYSAIGPELLIELKSLMFGTWGSDHGKDSSNIFSGNMLPVARIKRGLL